MSLMPSRKALVFLCLAYGLAWSLGFGFFALGGKIDSGAFVAMGVIYMFTPAIAAIITQKWIWKAPLRELGLGKPRMPWMVIAWLLPIALIVVSLAISLAEPGVTLVSGLREFTDKLADRVPPAQLEEMRSHLEQTILAKPGVLLWISFGQVLMAGPTINALVALGEELGWRGLLLRELQSLGFWCSSLLIGFLWGLWHLPMIVNGYNYPGHPVLGPVMMIALTILLAPLIGYVRLRAQSVFAAAVFHGSINAAATLAIFIKGGSVLTVGITGVTGLLTLLLANIALWLHLRRSGEQGELLAS